MASCIWARSITLDKNEGVQVMKSTPFASMSLASATGSWISSSVAMQTVMPLHRGMNSSMTEMSKVMAASASDTEALSV